MTNLNIAVITPDELAIASYTEGYRFTVKNNESFPVVFKIFTQHPELYTFAPAFALVLANGKVEVTIRLRVPTFYVAKLSGNSDVAEFTHASGQNDEEAERRRRRRDRKKAKRRSLRKLAKEADGSAEDDVDTASEGESSTDYSEDYASDVKDEAGTEKSVRRGRKKKARLERISTYLKTQISSGVFKVEIRVANTSIGSGVAETVFLSRQHSLEYIALKDIERKQRNSRSSKRLSTSISGENLSNSQSSGTYRPTGDELQSAISSIKNNAYSLFEHVWKNAIPHSTHTICCRTMREDLSTFFSKISESQQNDIQKLTDEHKALEKEVEALLKVVAGLRTQVDLIQQKDRLIEAGVPCRLFEDVTLNPDGGTESDNMPSSNAVEISEILRMLKLEGDASAFSSAQPKQNSKPKIRQQLMLPVWLVVLTALASFWMAFQTPQPIPLPAL